MPFTSQFSLSLELSRLVPLAQVGAKAAEMVMRLARDLQNSGSDIVVEEDMVGLFGRSRVQAQFASSFKNAVTKTATAKLCEGISLQAGAGPTVVRSLQHAPYFAMVVQCSLLAFCHEKWSLAGAIHRIFELQLQETLQDASLRASPSQEGIASFLETCTNQTAEFKWWRLVEAVQMSLKGQANAKEPIPQAVLRGAIQMFAMVQSLPEDRMVLIHTLDGIAVLVVWAHHVLGLTVCVRLKLKISGRVLETRFGDGNPQVVIEYPELGAVAYLPPSITMLESGKMDHVGAPHEVLFKIVSEPDDDALYATNLSPLKGLAKAFLSFDRWQEGKHSALERHLSLLAAAFALRLSRCIVLNSPETYSISDEEDFEHEEYEGHVEYIINQGELLAAVRLLCNDGTIKWAEIEEYEKTSFSDTGTALKLF